MSKNDSLAKPPRRRLSQAKRSESIAVLAAKLFAERGFHASGTRELARACGISEALMFRYFPNKEMLWKAALETCRQTAIADALRSLPSRPPSTAGLVDFTWELAEDYILNEPGERQTNHNMINRMMLRSLAEDGEFARMLMSDLSANMISYVSGCLAVARAARELDRDWSDDHLVSRFYRLLFFAIGALILPDQSVAAFDVPPEVVIQSAVRFQLRGLGLKSEVIERELAALEESKGLLAVKQHSIRPSGDGDGSGRRQPKVELKSAETPR